MDTMVQLLKESLRSSKEEFRGLGSNCWCAPHTPSAVPPSICVTARDTSRLICGSQGLQRWTLIVQGYLFGHNCTRISVETIVRAKATTVQWVQGRVVAGFSRSSSPDGGGGLEDVEVLQDVRDTHQPHGSQEPQTDPGPVQVDGDEGGGNSEVVHEGVELQHEPELIRGRNKLKRIKLSMS